MSGWIGATQASLPASQSGEKVAPVKRVSSSASLTLVTAWSASLAATSRARSPRPA